MLYSDAVLFGTTQHLKTMSSLTSVKIADSAIQFSDTIKILGVTLNSNLTLGPHIKAISKSCLEKHISCLQRVQHALARVLMQQAYRSSSSTELLKQLHWLPIEWRIRFKLATSTYKTLHTGHPPYLTDLWQYHKFLVSTRSSTSQLLAIPRHNSSFGSRSFRVSAPKIWNSLTPQIRQCQTLVTFRRHLKTHYFHSVFSAT